jgi:hypothetical protein
MDDIGRALSSTLHWVQPKAFHRCFELRRGEHVVGTLEFRSACGSLALAVTSAGRWTFKRVGFFSPRVTVRREGEETDLALYRARWTGTEGILEFPDRRTYMWKAANFWATQFGFHRADGGPLVTFSSGSGEGGLSNLFKSQARVEMPPAARKAEEVPLLVVLGWYLMVLQREDAAGSAASVAAMG